MKSKLECTNKPPNHHHYPIEEKNKKKLIVHKIQKYHFAITFLTVLAAKVIIKLCKIKLTQHILANGQHIQHNSLLLVIWQTEGKI